MKGSAEFCEDHALRFFHDCRLSPDWREWNGWRLGAAGQGRVAAAAAAGLNRSPPPPPPIELRLGARSPPGKKLCLHRSVEQRKDGRTDGGRERGKNSLLLCRRSSASAERQGLEIRDARSIVESSQDANPCLRVLN